MTAASDVVYLADHSVVLAIPAVAPALIIVAVGENHGRTTSVATVRSLWCSSISTCPGTSTVNVNS